MEYCSNGQSLYWRSNGCRLWYLPFSGTTSCYAPLSWMIHQIQRALDRRSQHSKACKSLWHHLFNVCTWVLGAVVCSIEMFLHPSTAHFAAHVWTDSIFCWSPLFRGIVTHIPNSNNNCLRRLYSLVITLDDLLHTVCLIMPRVWDALTTAVCGISIPCQQFPNLFQLLKSQSTVWSHSLYSHGTVTSFFLPKCSIFHSWMFNSSLC